MRDFHPRKKVFVLGAALLLVCVTATVFFIRRPVIVVTDEAFDALYGEPRASRRRLYASFFLFRRIAVATVASTAAPQTSSDAAFAAAPNAVCAVFPSRYEAGAVAYASRGPQYRSIIVGDSGIASDDLAGSNIFLHYYKNNRAIDLYRAGKMAGLLVHSDGGGVAIVLDSSSDTASLDAVSSGLSGSGYSGSPVVLVPGTPAASFPRFSCVIFAAPEHPELIEGLEHVPSILFSWIDPHLLPPEALVAFDDSIWALLVPATRGALSKSAVQNSPSAVIIPPSSWSAVLRSASKSFPPR